MKTVLGSYDSANYQVILSKMKEEQKILQLEEQIDIERIKINALNQEAKLLAKRIQLTKGKKSVSIDKYRGTSLPKYYPENSPYREKALIRNTILSTAYKDF